MRNKQASTITTLLQTAFYTLLGIVCAGLVYFISPFSLAVTGPSPLSGLSVTPASKDLGATTSYTLAFTAPRNLVGGTVGSFDPFDMVMFDIFPNGPEDDTTKVNLSNVSIGSGTNVSIAVGDIGVDEWSSNRSNETELSFTSNVASGTSVKVVLSGVVNPSVAGQHTANVNIGGPGGSYQGQVKLLLGVGDTQTVSGQVVLSTTGVGVADASINANQRMGQLFFNTDADDSGNYSLELPAGEWELRVGAQWAEGGQKTVDWAFSGFGKAVTISDASKTVNFEVIPATATVKGKVVKPDGTPADGGLDVKSKDGVGVNGGVNPDTGAFSFKVPAGSYRLGFWSDDPSYTAPELDPFTVSENSTKDLGTITLVKKTSKIKGKVTDKASGAGISGVRMNAWSPEGSGWGETTSGSDGSYELLVGAGTWEVMPQPDSSLGYAFEAGPPNRIKIAKDETKSGVDFKLTKANATITGTVVDVNNSQITDFFGFAMAMEGSGDPPKPGPGTDAFGGQFTLRVPAGTWTVNVETEPGSEFSSTGGKTVTVVDDETKTVTITMKENDAMIKGVIKDDEGNAVTGVRTEVFAENGRGSFKFTIADPSDGSYEMGVVGGGSWYMGVFVEPDSGYVMLPPSDNKTSVASGETVTKNFTLLKANAAISGTIKDPDGNGLSNVFIFADTNLVDDGGVLGAKTIGGPNFAGGPMKDDQGVMTGDLTDSDGNFTLNMPAGTYGLGSGAPSSMGYISPAFKRVEVAKDETKTGVVLQYRQSDAQINGSVYLDGSKTGAFVWAWSETGAHSESFTRTGDYTLNVTKGEVWHIGADYEIGQKFYQSSEFVVDLTSASSATQDLTLSEASFEMPPAVSQSIDASSGGTIILEDGLRVVIPAGALGSSGTYTVTVTPTAQLTKEKSRRPLAFGYRITAIDSNGQEFTSTFSSNVRLVIPYSDAMLTALGIAEDNLNASFFDSTSSVWQGVDSFTVNKEDNTIVATISHFTDFALTTGSADSTPPADPTSVTATSGIEKVTLSWTNPTDADFDHINIYRSETEGWVGTLHTSTTSSSTTTYEDTGLNANKTYYYTLKAVDTVGNESSGASQVSAMPSPASVELPATGVSISAAMMFYLNKLVELIGIGFDLLLLQ